MKRIGTSFAAVPLALSLLAAVAAGPGCDGGEDGSDLNTRRASYEQRIEQNLERVQQELAETRQELQHAGEAVRGDLESQVEDLQDLQRDLDRHLADLEEQTEDTWNRWVTEVDQTLAEVGNHVDRQEAG
jgi:flagellar motility protein MotE (MotC chaperone)